MAKRKTLFALQRSGIEPGQSSPHQQGYKAVYVILVTLDILFLHFVFIKCDGCRSVMGGYC